MARAPRCVKCQLTGSGRFSSVSQERRGNGKGRLGGEAENPTAREGNQRGVVIRDDIPALLWTALLNKHFFITYLFSIKPDLDTNFGHLVHLGDSDKGNRGVSGGAGVGGGRGGMQIKRMSGNYELIPLFLWFIY